MINKPIGKRAEPKAEELEFIYRGFTEKLSDREVLESMQNEPFLLRSLGFIIRRRREFDAAKKVLQEQLKNEIDPIVTARKSQHFEQMAMVAQALLGGLDIVEFKGEDDYEIASSKVGSASLSLNEVIEELKENIYKAHEEYRSMGTYQCFLAHLEAEEPSCQELAKYAENSPLELINLLKMLILKKEFKGTCPVCVEQKC